MRKIAKQDKVKGTLHFISSQRYRKVVLNNCTNGVKEMYTPRKQQCPNRPPKGLLLTTKDGKMTANLGSNVTFLVHLDEVKTNTCCFFSCFHPLTLIQSFFLCTNRFLATKGKQKPMSDLAYISVGDISNIHFSSLLQLGYCV